MAKCKPVVGELPGRGEKRVIRQNEGKPPGEMPLFVRDSEIILLEMRGEAMATVGEVLPWEK